MEIIWPSILGLLIGSFLNVVIYRVPRKLSVVNPRRSYCPNCNTQLNWYENIPVISWLALGAKCKHCGTAISGQYPLVELLSAAAAVATYIYFGLSITALVIYSLSAALIAITFIDLEHKIIPNLISYPGMIIGLWLGIISQYTNAFSPPVTQSALDSLLGLLAGGGFFYVIGSAYYLFTKRVGLGGGDIKLMGMTGAILGLHSIPTTIVLGSFLGSIIGIGMMIFAGGGRHSEIPFGPYLAIGALLFIFADPSWLPF